MKNCPVLSVVAVVLSCGVSHAAEPVDYTEQIKPILAARCYACHGALKQEEGLRLDTASLARRGGDSGPALQPGSAERSLLIERVVAEDIDFRMPPEGEPLSAQQIILLRDWIDSGAIAPRDEQPDEDPRLHWAFQRPQRPPLPVVNDTARLGNPIDSFIAAEHQRQGLTPSPKAERRVLLRRLYIDLIGLPPTRDQLHAFLADRSADAYQRVVDRLLASPQYGERWGRHWMDVWRYSDWYGRRRVNDVRNSYPHIWRWRDWIVDSLNDDKPYDRMIVEMLAGDEVAADDDATVVATGFIARNWFSLNYDQWMKDLVEHTGKAFLGLRLNCAHCHDHKYDPISQQEYFQFRAFFEPLELRQDRVPGGGDLPRFKKYLAGSGSSLKPIAAGLVRVFDKNLQAKTYMYRLGDTRDRMEERGPVEPAAPAILGGERLNIEPVDLPPVAYFPGLRPFVAEEEISRCRGALRQAEADVASADGRAGVDVESLALAVARARLADARAQLAAVEARIAADRAKYGDVDDDLQTLCRAASRAERSAAVTAAQLALAEGELALEQANLKAAADSKAAAEAKKAAARIAALKKALAKARQALKTDSQQYSSISPTYPRQSTGRRTALARWIASSENPLTARVAVNHIWMRHFGAPLVASVFDFGRAGEQPTHPQLLDYLAVEWMQSGWRMKNLHRLIVTSNTYKMSSAAANDENRLVDADNRYLWRFNNRRAEAEVIRDSVLYLAGQLDTRLGGQELDAKLGPTTRRRSLYYSVYPEEGGRLQFAGLFDAPSTNDCYRRSQSIVPQQALAMTNGRISLNQGRLLARQLWSQVQQAETGQRARRSAFVVAAFEQLLSRPPSLHEQQLCREFLDRQVKLFDSVQQQDLAAPPVKGLVAASTDPQERARESFVRSLFSHHDFVTIR